MNLHEVWGVDGVYAEFGPETTDLTLVHLVDESRVLWTPCRHPERPPDERMVYHLRASGSGPFGPPCIGCVVMAEAQYWMNESPVGLLRIVSQGELPR